MHEELAAYALGALEPASRRDLEAAVAADPGLSHELRDLSEVTALLALAVPARTPPASLRERVVGAALAARPLAVVPGTECIEEAPEERQVVKRLPIDAAAIGDRRRSRALVAMPWVLAAASLGMVVLSSRRTGDERALRTRAEGEARALALQLAAADALVATLTAADVRTAALAATGAPPAARLYWNRTLGEVVLAGFRLPRAPAGKTYQLWGIATGGTPVSLGTFQQAGEGREVARFRVPPGLDMQIGAVTEEPAGGSVQPTATPFLAGTVRIAD